jgi:hypothetical protein
VPSGRGNGRRGDGRRRNEGRCGERRWDEGRWERKRRSGGKVEREGRSDESSRGKRLRA